MLKGYIADQDGIGEQDATRWQDEQKRLGGEGAFFFCVTQFCFQATKPDPRRR
jgi:hypothetical protein